MTCSVLDRQGVSGQKPDKVSYMTQQINRKFIMIWWEQWELTHWSLLSKPCFIKTLLIETYLEP